jgi:hypothetical protein
MTVQNLYRFFDPLCMYREGYCNLKVANDSYYGNVMNSHVDLWQEFLLVYQHQQLAF